MKSVALYAIISISSTSVGAWCSTDGVELPMT